MSRSLNGLPTLSSGHQSFDPCDFGCLQVEINNAEIDVHVIGIGRPGQGDHAEIKRKSKDNLADAATVALCDVDHIRMHNR